MNEFESRYFPFKRFSRRHLKFSRSRELRCTLLPEFNGKLRVRQLRLTAPKKEAAGKKLAFISDWHWHNSPYQQNLLAELTGISNKIKPDILLLGGDLCDDAEFLPDLPVLLEALGAMAPQVFTVNGNWEAGKRWLPEDYFAQLYAQCNIKLLENESADTGIFRITGLPDISSINFRRLENFPDTEDRIGILLTHNPDNVVAAGKNDFLKNFALAFCGHTHGGQVRIPCFGALYCPSFYRCKFDRGIFDCNSAAMKMIVSSGISEHNNSFRLFCPPEMILVEFC